jgi:hypothetical protein
MQARNVTAKKMMESVEHPKPKKIKAEVWDLSK